MNKLCSRNTALATAVGRSGLRTDSLSASRGFLSLRCPCSFHPVPRSFQLSSSFSFALHPPALSLSRNRRHIGVPHSSSLSLSLSFKLTSFCLELRYCESPLRLRCLAHVLLLLRFSQWSRCLSVLIPPTVFIAPTLASYAASCNRDEQERAQNSPLVTSLFSRVAVPATEQISNKWDDCAKPRRFNYWCLVAAHRESRAVASLRSCRWYSFFSSISSLPSSENTHRYWRCSLYLFPWMPS